ncbi:nitrous oxide reductase accessory protein NosL [Atopomonas hussainii]|uniref:nitrous oxide reductase accessory protein NosL n=1 Tax=Atopomonas hussainii TaxID=1429083 RepID=UPI000900140F|nr:nitrous oxide reductase accessory protein NosL [Atopomonas hussainii]
MRAAMLSLLLAATVGLAGCEQQTTEALKAEPVAFHKGDECHVCGMAITDFPGPKGQAVLGQGQAKKFCSTAELIGWYLQPENQTQKPALFVHDMGRSDWHHPDDRHLINAQDAYFVVAPSLPGAMGVTLASFADAEQAQTLANKEQGEVLRLGDFNHQRLQQLASLSSHSMHGHGAHSSHGASPAPAAHSMPNHAMPEHDMPAHNDHAQH